MVEKLRLFSAGATSNYFGQFLVDQIKKSMTDSKVITGIGSSAYISAVIAGGFTGIANLSGFKGTTLALGLNYVLFDTIDRMMGGEGKDRATFLKAFIYDALIVYFIIQLINQFLDLFTDNDEVESSFGERVLRGMVIGTVINFVLFQRVQSTENNSDN